MLLALLLLGVVGACAGIAFLSDVREKDLSTTRAAGTAIVYVARKSQHGRANTVLQQYVV